MFENRRQAGELLAQRLKEKGYGGEETIVFAILRGGVVIGREVADLLNSVLDVIVVRKIPAPNQPELALGAVGPDNVRVLDVDMVERTGATKDYLKNKTDELKIEVAAREQKFRHEEGGPSRLTEKTLILVDDGIATGSTIEAAIRFLRTKNPKRIVLAVPVAARDSIENLEELVEEILVIETPKDFRAVGQFYKEFSQVTDEEVVKLLSNQ